MFTENQENAALATYPIMDYNEYFKTLTEIAKELIEEEVDQWTWLAQRYKQAAGPVWIAIEWRKSELTPEDIDHANGYLPIGYLREFDTTTRLSFFTVSFEIGTEFHKLAILRACEKYNPSQPIFRQKPALWNEIRKRDSGTEDLELISLSHLKQYEDSELFEFEGTNLILSRALKPSIIHWANTEFPGVPMYARFNAYKCQTTKIRLLEFAMIVPPNPNWWANTRILRGQVDGGSFILQDCPCSIVNQTNYWEYNFKHLRKLEISAQRENNNNLKMSLEELSVDSAGIIGRMIHLDSDSPSGTPADKCILNHLDLAINYYLNESANTRMSQRLSDGKVIDASVRTHIFRIEGIPLSSVLCFVDMFFESTILKKEWRDSQLGCE